MYLACYSSPSSAFTPTDASSLKPERFTGHNGNAYRRASIGSGRVRWTATGRLPCFTLALVGRHSDSWSIDLCLVPALCAAAVLAGRWRP